jgi:hypothetical protein
VDSSRLKLLMQDILRIFYQNRSLGR